MSDTLIEKPPFSGSSTYQVLPQLQLLGVIAVSSEKPSRLDGLIATVSPYENETAGYARPLWPATDDETWAEAKDRRMSSLYIRTPVEIMLRKAQWRRDRRIDFTRVTKEIERNGYTLSEAAKELLSELSGLKITAEANWMFFDVLQVASAFTKRDVSILEKKLHEKICPVAVTSSAYVFVGSTGKLFVLDQDWLFIRIARNIEELLTSMMSRGASALPAVTIAAHERPPDLR
jgi:hypothetical protein